MPTPLEHIVRPFQTLDAVPDKATIVTTVVKQAAQKAIITWGAAGQQPKPYSTGISFKVKDPFEFEEYERFSTDVRVENPDDKDQFIVAARPDQVSFRKTKDPTSETVTTNKSGASGGAADTTATKAGTEDTVSDVTTETVATSSSKEKDAYTYKLKQPSS